MSVDSSNIADDINQMALCEKTEQAKTEEKPSLHCDTLHILELVGDRYEILNLIDLSEKNLMHLPESIGSAVSLQFLNVSKNCLSSIPCSIQQLKMLKEFNASYNILTELPELFAELTSLDKLNLSHNKFKSVPVCLEIGCPRISYLNLAYNDLCDWDSPPQCVYALNFLSLSHNNMKSNPAWLWTDLCHSLEDLDLSYNNFQNMANVCKKNRMWHRGVSVTLKNINLSNTGFSSSCLTLINELKAVTKCNIGNKKPATMYPGRSRQDIKFSNNAIWQLQMKPLHCHAVLTELVMCGVGLSILPNDIGCLRELQTLDCQENELQWLPESFSNLLKLKTMIFSHNKLLYLPEDIGKLSSLEELVLDNNKLEHLPDSLADLTKLRWLDLYHNLLEEKPTALEKILTHLHGIDLEGNQFVTSDLMDLEVEYGEMSYEDLKKALRDHPILDIKRDLCRVDVMGSRPSSANRHHEGESWPSSSSAADSDEEISLVSSTTEDERERLVDDDQLKPIEETEEELWDLDDGADDYFDPTDVSPRAVVQCAPLHVVLIRQSISDPNTFCPADIHPSPSIRSPKDPFNPDEGQFDDA